MVFFRTVRRSAARVTLFAGVAAVVYGCPAATSIDAPIDPLAIFTLRPLDVNPQISLAGSVVRARAFVGTGVEPGLVAAAGSRVLWAVTSGGGTVVVENDPTDGFGQASARWTLGSSAGPQTLTATLATANGQPSNNPRHMAIFTATAFTNAVDRVTVLPADTTLTVGASFPLRYSLLNSQGTPLTGRVITASSSNAAVATVSVANGVATVNALTAGTTDISVLSEGKSGSARITVAPVPVASLTLSPETATIDIGATVPLTAVTRSGAGLVLTGRAVTFASGTPAVATVAADGVVRGVAEGVTSVIATSEGKADTSTITVRAPACTGTAVCTVTISTNGNRTSLQVTHTLLFQTILRDAAGNQITSGANVTYASSNNAIARVDVAPPGGPPGYFANIIGVSVGRVTISATADGRTASVVIDVTP